MKLFIINKNKLDFHFPENGNGSMSAKEIHQSAYKELKLSIDLYDSIPINLVVELSETSVVSFLFISKKDETFFYEYAENL